MLYSSKEHRTHANPCLTGNRWLQENRLDPGDLAFIRNIDGALLVSPLILKQFFPISSGTSSRTAKFDDPMALINIRNSCIYTLGIFLIELYLGQTMQDLQEPEDAIPGGMLEFLPEFLAAKRLVNVVYDEAVRRCIYCDFDQREYDLDNEEFCQAVYEGVVAPLEENVKLIDGPDALLTSPFSYARPLSVE